ncbi:MAG: hypothetical protein U0232_19310 [Thermomicrobiales bacterium]
MSSQSGHKRLMIPPLGAGARRGAARGTLVGCVVAIVVNLILIAVARSIPSWGLSFVTPAFDEVLPAIERSLIAAVVVNAILCAYDAAWFPAPGAGGDEHVSPGMPRSRSRASTRSTGSPERNDVAHLLIVLVCVAVVIAIFAGRCRCCWRSRGGNRSSTSSDVGGAGGSPFAAGLPAETCLVAQRCYGAANASIWHSRGGGDAHAEHDDRRRRARSKLEHGSTWRPIGGARGNRAPTRRRPGTMPRPNAGTSGRCCSGSQLAVVTHTVGAFTQEAASV